MQTKTICNVVAVALFSHAIQYLSTQPISNQSPLSFFPMFFFFYLIARFLIHVYLFFIQLLKRSSWSVETTNLSLCQCDVKRSKSQSSSPKAHEYRISYLLIFRFDPISNDATCVLWPPSTYQI